MPSNMQQQASKATVNAVGANGSLEITGTSIVSAPAGSYIFAIDFMSDSVVAAQGNVTGAVNADLTAIASIPPKAVYGKWTSVTLTSGDAIGYLSNL